MVPFCGYTWKEEATILTSRFLTEMGSPSYFFSSFNPNIRQGPPHYTTDVECGLFTCVPLMIY